MLFCKHRRTPSGRQVTQKAPGGLASTQLWSSAHHNRAAAAFLQASLLVPLRFSAIIIIAVCHFWGEPGANGCELCLMFRLTGAEQVWSV